MRSPSLDRPSFPPPTDFRQSSFVGPPPNVSRYGNIKTMPVRSPLSKGNPGKMLLLLQREMNPKTLMLGVSQLNNVTLISARDAQYSRPLVLASVTDQDADFNGLPIEELSERWRDILEADLRNSLANLPTDRQRVRQIIFGLILITGLVIGLKYALIKPQKRLRQQQQDNNIDTIADISQLSPEDQPTTLREQIEHRRITL